MRRLGVALVLTFASFGVAKAQAPAAKPQPPPAQVQPPGDRGGPPGDEGGPPRDRVQPPRDRVQPPRDEVRQQPPQQPERPERPELRVDLVADDEETEWQVSYDRQNLACTTPCTQFIDPRQRIFMRPSNRTRDLVSVRLTDYQDAQAVQVRARGFSHGEYATGITFLSLGGMAAITGGTLWLVGALKADDRTQGMATAGMITGGAGAFVALGGLWLLFDSFPRAEVLPAGKRMLVVGPGSVAGRF